MCFNYFLHVLNVNLSFAPPSTSLNYHGIASSFGCHLKISSLFSPSTIFNMFPLLMASHMVKHMRPKELSVKNTHSLRSMRTSYGVCANTYQTTEMYQTLQNFKNPRTCASEPHCFQRQNLKIMSQTIEICTA